MCRKGKLSVKGKSWEDSLVFIQLHNHNHFPQLGLMAQGCNPITLVLKQEGWRLAEICEILALKNENRQAWWCRPVFPTSTLEAEAGVTGV